MAAAKPRAYRGVGRVTSMAGMRLGSMSELMMCARERRLQQVWAGSSSSSCEMIGSNEECGSYVGVSNYTGWCTAVVVYNCNGWCNMGWTVSLSAPASVGGSDGVAVGAMTGAGCTCLAGNGVVLPASNARRCSIAASLSGAAGLAPSIVDASCCVAFTIRSVGNITGMGREWCLNFQVLVSLTAPDYRTPLIDL